MSHEEALTLLPFVEEREDGTLDYWAIEPSGDRWSDEQRGTRLGRMAVRHMAFYECAPGLLLYAVRCMVEKGRFGALEEAFLATVGGCALRYVIDHMDRSVPSNVPSPECFEHELWRP